jgi:nucleoid-associated protein YgaU
MPRNTKRARTTRKNNSIDKVKDFLSQVKLGESYTSLFLGAVVVVIALVLVFSFLRGRNLFKPGITQPTSTVNEQQTGNRLTPTTYTVQKGESLWTIAEKIYGSGYNWVDLAKANNLTNPGVIFSDTKLIVPNVAPKMLTVQNQQIAPVGEPITGTTYTVKGGDCLWTIALRAYGDGYKWVEIAKTNNLINPNFIHSGNVFKLPR